MDCIGSDEENQQLLPEVSSKSYDGDSNDNYESSYMSQSSHSSDSSANSLNQARIEKINCTQNSYGSEIDLSRPCLSFPKSKLRMPPLPMLEVERQSQIKYLLAQESFMPGQPFEVYQKNKTILGVLLLLQLAQQMVGVWYENDQNKML